MTKDSPPSFRGARTANKPGIQKQSLSIPLDSGFTPAARPEVAVAML